MSVQLELDASNELFTQTTEVGPDQTCLEMTRRAVPDGFIYRQPVRMLITNRYSLEL